MPITMTAAEAVGATNAGRILGVSSRHVLRLIESGQLTATKTDIGRLIPLDDVQRLAREREMDTARPRRLHGRG